MRKIVSGNIFNDVKRLFSWGGKKVGGRLKKGGKGFFHRILEAMNR
jgi:hypothetical protein